MRLKTHRITNARHNVKSTISHKKGYITLNIYVFALGLRWFAFWACRQRNAFSFWIPTHSVTRALFLSWVRVHIALGKANDILVYSTLHWVRVGVAKLMHVPM